MEPILWNDPNRDGEWDVKNMFDQTTRSLMSIMFAVLMSELNLRLHLIKAVRCCWCPAGGLDAFTLQPCLRISMCRVFMMNVKGHDLSEVNHALRMTPRPLTDVNGDQRKRLFHFMSLPSVYIWCHSADSRGQHRPCRWWRIVATSWIMSKPGVRNNKVITFNSWLSAKDDNIALGHCGVNIMLNAS